MSDTVNITIAVPANVLYNSLKLILDYYKPVSQLPETVSFVKVDDDYLREFIMQLLEYCRKHDDFKSVTGKVIIRQLITCIGSKDIYIQFIEFLKNIRTKYEYCYKFVIFSYIKDEINDPEYETYIADDDDDDILYNIVNLLIVKYKQQDDTDTSGSKDDLTKDTDDMQHILEAYNNEKEKEPFDVSQLNMLNMVDDTMFENMLNHMGMNADSKTKAYKIKKDIKEGNPLNMEEIYTFTQEYKQFLPESGVNFGALMEMFKPKETKVDKKVDTKVDTKESPPNDISNFLSGIDMNSVMNSIGPMLNNLTGGGRGNGRSRRGRGRR